MGGAGDPAKSAVEAALASGKSVVTANKALLAKHGVKLAALAEKHRVALNFEAAVGGAIPIVKTLREGTGRQFDRAHLRHSQRHLQLHPHADGAGEAVVRRMPEGSAAARLCRSRSELSTSRATTPRRSWRSWPSLAFGTKVDQSAIYVEGISSITPADLAAADELGYRVKLARRRGENAEGHRAARASDHGAQGFRDRPGDGRDQRRDRRCRGHQSAHAGRARRRRRGDRFGGAVRYRRHRARRAHRAVRPAGRAARQPCARRRCSATRAATTSGCWRATSRAPPRPSRTRLAEQEISLESIVQRHDQASLSDDAKGGAVPVILITYATSEGCRAQGPCGGGRAIG